MNRRDRVNCFNEEDDYRREYDTMEDLKKNEEGLIVVRTESSTYLVEASIDHDWNPDDPEECHCILESLGLCHDIDCTVSWNDEEFCLIFDLIDEINHGLLK